MKKFLITFLIFSLLPFSISATEEEKIIYYANKDDNMIFPQTPIFKRCWIIYKQKENICTDDNNNPFTGILRYETQYDKKDHYWIIEEEFKDGKLIRQTSNSNCMKINFSFNNDGHPIKIKKYVDLFELYENKELCYTMDDTPNQGEIQIKSGGEYYRIIKYDRAIEGSIAAYTKKINRTEPDVFYSPDKKTRLNGKYFWKFRGNLRTITLKNGILNGNFIQYDDDDEEEFFAEFQNGFAISGYYYQTIDNTKQKIIFSEPHLFAFNKDLFYKNPTKPDEDIPDFDTLKADFYQYGLDSLSLFAHPRRYKIIPMTSEEYEQSVAKAITDEGLKEYHKVMLRQYYGFQIGAGNKSGCDDAFAKIEE